MFNNGIVQHGYHPPLLAQHRGGACQWARTKWKKLLRAIYHVSLRKANGYIKFGWMFDNREPRTYWVFASIGDMGDGIDKCVTNDDGDEDNPHNFDDGDIMVEMMDGAVGVSDMVELPFWSFD